MNSYKCCICGKTAEGYGNNPWPVVKDEKAKCCDDCNIGAVLPARAINAMMKQTCEALANKTV